MTPLVIQLHPDIPVFQSPKRASKTLGIGRDSLIEGTRRAHNPIPHARNAKGVLINIPRAIEWIDEGNL